MLYLLRVGADKKYGGFHSPIFKDYTYLFIPIPDNNVIREKSIQYSEYQWNNQPILSYIPKELPSKTIHNDPEFITCTYGSPKLNNKNKIEKNYNKLSDLKKNDLLVFYAAFKCELEKSLSGYYFFAYFIIEEVIKYSKVNSLNENQKARIQNNHHYIHNWSDQVIVVGNRDKSRIFEKAVLLSSKQYDRERSNYYPCEKIRDLLNGYNKSMNMSSIRTIKTGIKEFQTYLDKKSSKNLLVDFQE